MFGLFTSEVPALLVAKRPPQLLWGQEDKSAPRKVADKIASETGAAEPTMLADSGHMPQLEAPALFVSALERTLAR